MQPTVATHLLADRLPAAQRSLRIAFVTETYPPEINGVALTVACMVEGLHERNHDLQLIRPWQGGSAAADQRERFQEVLTRGLPIPRYPDLRMGVPAKRVLMRLWAMRRPDVVHIATEGPLGWSALQAARQLQLPVCSDFRTNFHAYSTHYGIGWLRKPIYAYLRAFHNRTAFTMVPTEALRSELRDSGFRNVCAVSRGVDTLRFHPRQRNAALRESWGLADDDLAVICVGRLAPEKNLGVLLSAFEAIQQVNARARLIIVGDGPLRSDLQRRCPNAEFAGQRSGDDLAAHYASADLFLFPSLTETFGNVTTEALASGLALVAFDHAAAAQLIRCGHNGMVVPLGNSSAFVQAAVTLAGDAAQRRRIAQRARESAATLDWAGVVLRFEAVLAQAIQASAMPRDSGALAPHTTVA